MDPKDYRYSKEHEWVVIDPNGMATIGITEYAQKELGDVVFIELPAPGTSFQQFAKFGEIESVKSVSELFTPIGGEVVEANKELTNQPELVNSAPYREGWMLKIKPADLNEINNLMTAEQYEEYLKTPK